MKTLHLLIMIGVTVIAIIIGIFMLEFNQKNSTVSIETNQTHTTPPNISTIIIPKGSGDPSSGKNYDPRYLLVVLGINNTVRWINEDDEPNTIVDDTYNQPDPLFEKGPYSKKVIMPGKSFNFTFTKIGEYQYDTEPHPWLYGWVLVLPKSPENATHTVIVNDTKIPGPCEIFRIPCPNSTSFTAQKFGPDIYIEKVTINGYDKYAIVHPSTNCVYPPSYNGFETCRNPDDLAILRLAGVDTSIPQENLSIVINGLNSTYAMGDPVNFGITVKGYGHCDSPSILVIREGVIVWQSKTAWVSCTSTMSLIDDKYTIGDLGGPFYLNQSGTYAVHVGYASNMTEEQFNITSLEGISKTNHMTYAKNNDPLGIVALVNYTPYDSCLGLSCPPYTFYLKINAKSTAYLLGYDICGNDLCVKNNTLSILLPISNTQISNYAFIGISENKKWNYGDTADMKLEVSPTPYSKDAYFLDMKNSTIVP